MTDHTAMNDHPVVIETRYAGCRFRSRLEARRTIDYAAALSDSRSGCGGGHDMVVFGRIPNPDSDHMPTRLHMHKGSVTGSAWWGEGNGVHQDWRADEIAQDSGDWSGEVLGWAEARSVSPEDVMRKWLLGGSWACYGHGPDDRADVTRRFRAAYTTARSARFEHGESPAVNRKGA